MSFIDNASTTYNLLTKENPYKGAGVLFVYKEECLLGRRRYNPGAGLWSVPGGGLEHSDKNNLYKTAIRETVEEFGDIQSNDLYTSTNIDISEGIKCASIILPKFQFNIYGLILSKKPHNWPNPCHEFTDAKWFDINSLPINTHPGVIYALWRFNYLPFYLMSKYGFSNLKQACGLN